MLWVDKMESHASILSKGKIMRFNLVIDAFLIIGKFLFGTLINICNVLFFLFLDMTLRPTGWTKVASMSTRRLGVGGVAVLAGYLYAVGGSDGTSPLNTGMQQC